MVVPGKEDTTRGFDYWLNAVKLFGAGSPLIMVMNKADLRLKHIDEASFQEKFPNIARFLQVSCLTGLQVPELTETIRNAFSHIPHLLDKLPKRWMEIRDELKSRPGYSRALSAGSITWFAKTITGITGWNCGSPGPGRWR